MARPNASRIVNGTYGSVWFDGERWAEVNSFEAKVTVKHEDVNFACEGATFKKALGWSGEGSMTIKKIYSRVQEKMAEKVRKGTYPRFEIVGKLADPDAYGSERVVIRDVTVNEFMLLKFEQKTVGSVDIPFAFSDYEMVDMIR